MLVKKTASRRTPEQVVDSVRAGVSVKKPADAEQILEHLAKDYPIADEGWKKTEAGYFDRKAAARMTNGQLAEIQFWPPGMIESKTEGHKMYEQHRVLPDKASAEAKALTQKMIDHYGKVEKALSPEWAALFAR